MLNESLKLDDVLSWTNGKVLNTGQVSFDFIGTDSRSDLSGQLFVPLRGDVFDAHDFIKSAIEKGAAGVVFDRKSKKPVSALDLSTVTAIEVEDTLLAFQQIASGYRSKMKQKIIGITGSVGKTTAKEFTSQILNSFQPTYANQGSFNNHWGVPISLLNMRRRHKIGVIEMGMNHYGEIQRLVEIADPDIVVCTMVGLAHFEHFGSQENIAKAKNEIYRFSRESTVRVFNWDDPFTIKMRNGFTGGNCLEFSQKNSAAAVFMQLKNVTSEGLHISGSIAGLEGNAVAPIFGRHNLTNIMASAALALAAGMDSSSIWEQIAQLKTNWGRNQLLQADGGAQIIFDGYNANPDSMESLIKNVQETPTTGKRILILAEMLELGVTKDQFHFELGKKVIEHGIDQVIFYGPSWEKFKEAFSEASGSTEVWASERMDESLINKMKTTFQSGDLIGIKGSRGMKTEKVVSLLVKAFSHEKI